MNVFFVHSSKIMLPSIDVTKMHISPTLHSLASFISNLITTRLLLIPKLSLLIDTSFLFAAPKKRVTLSTRRKRNFHHRLLPLKNISKCSICNRPNLLHQMCLFCFARIRKIEARLKAKGLKDWNFK